MGEVFLARHLSPESSRPRLVALKRLLPRVATDAEHLRMFLEEAACMGRVRHPNVAEMYELAWHAGQPAIVMEYIAGDSLKALLGTVDASHTTTMPFGLASGLFAGVAHALGAVHAAGLIHGDVTPSNVMVADTGAVKLIDFGVARSVHSAASSTPGRLKGKLAYMAPEYLRGDPYDHRVDVFSLGVLMWEVVTGRRLFDAAALGDQLRVLLRARIPRVDAVVPGVPAALSHLIARALARDPRQRVDDAVALGQELAALAVRLPRDPGCATLEDLLRARRCAHVEDRRHFRERFARGCGIEGYS